MLLVCLSAVSIVAQFLRACGCQRRRVEVAIVAARELLRGGRA